MKTLKVKTTGLTGKKWLTRMEQGKYKVSSCAKDILLSKEFDSMRLKKGVEQEVAFVSVKDLGKEYATTQEIKDYAKSKGYGMPTPELALLLRESISDEEIKALGVWYVAVLHEPIKDSGGNTGVLRSYRDADGRWLDAYWGRPDDRWSTGGASAFPVSASSTQKFETKPLNSVALNLVSEIEEQLAKLKKLI